MSQIEIAGLADICSLVTDGTHDSPKLQEHGVPFIKGKHINSGRVDFVDCDYITSEDHEKCIKRVRPQLDDILMANIGASIGDCARVTTNKEFSIKNVALLRPDAEKVDPSYFFHLVKSGTFQGRLMNLRLGSAQPYVSLTALRGFGVPIVSDMASQKRIGAICSAYDDLIENNRRRIALLEQAARLLYREWFVHFRFPGHETAKFVDGLPEGWARTELREVCSTNKASHKKGKIPDPVRYIDIGSVSTGRIDGVTEYMAEDAPGRARRIAEPMDTIWSNVRPNLQAYSLVMSPKENDVFSTGFTILHAETISPLFLYLTVTTDDFVKYLTNHATGASYPAVRSDDFDRAEVLVPSEALMNAFHEFAEPIFQQRQMLGENNDQLSKARDLLLPRLMDGRIPA